MKNAGATCQIPLNSQSATHNQGNGNQVLPRLNPFRTVAEYTEMVIWLRNASDSELLDVEQIEAQFVPRRQFRQDFGYVVASAQVMDVLSDLLPKNSVNPSQSL